MAIAMTPEVAATESVQVVVETFDPVRLGESKVSGRPGPMEVMGRVDRDRFLRLFAEFLGPEHPTSLT
jgi:inosine-uridine nucleoside N-ribohydrolase